MMNDAPNDGGAAATAAAAAAEAEAECDEERDDDSRRMCPSVRPYWIQIPTGSVRARQQPLAHVQLPRYYSPFW